eukprot:jgi/Hompol1/3760/HPOL_003354-RA
MIEQSSSAAKRRKTSVYGKMPDADQQQVELATSDRLANYYAKHESEQTVPMPPAATPSASIGRKDWTDATGEINKIEGSVHSHSRISGHTGLAADTRLLLFNGGVKRADQICDGDVLMGDDSTPRVVLPGSITSTTAPLLRFTSSNRTRTPWACSRDHFLPLKIIERPYIVKCTRPKPWFIQSWTVRPSTHPGSFIPYRTSIRSDFMSRAEAQAALDEIISNNWKPLDFCSVAADAAEFGVKSSRHVQMFQPSSVTWSLPQDFVPLSSYLATLLSPARSSSSSRSSHNATPDLINLIAWSIGVWICSGIEDTSDIEIIAQSRDNDRTAVLNSLKRCATQLRAAATTIEKPNYRTTLSGMPVTLVKMGPLFQSVLAHYQVLETRLLSTLLLTESKSFRQHLLAGIIDGSGFWDRDANLFRICVDCVQIYDGVCHLIRGLGLVVGLVGKVKQADKSGDDAAMERMQVTIAGMDLDPIAKCIKLDVNRPATGASGGGGGSGGAELAQNDRDMRSVGFSIEPAGTGDVISFVLDGNVTQEK